MKSFLGVANILLAGWIFSGAAARAQFPDGPGKQVVQEACSVCHGTEVITSMRRSKAEWTETVQDMVSRGAPLKEGEREVVIEYLAANFGPEKAEAMPADRSQGKGAQSEPVRRNPNRPDKKNPAFSAANGSPSGHDFSRAGESASIQRFQPLRVAPLMALPQGLKPRIN